MRAWDRLCEIALSTYATKGGEVLALEAMDLKQADERGSPLPTYSEAAPGWIFRATIDGDGRPCLAGWSRNDLWAWFERAKGYMRDYEGVDLIEAMREMEEQAA